MSRNSFLVITLAAILLIGGFLTVQILINGSNNALPGLIVQTDDPNASALAATGEQAVVFVVFFLFSTGSLLGIGAVMALVLRFLDRQVTQAKEEDK